MTNGRLLAFIAVLAALAIAGCGREPSDDTSTTESTTEEADVPLEPPQPKESIDDAVKRLAKALDSEDCKDISEFNLSSRPIEDEEARCDGLITLLGGRKVLGSEEFSSGGVVDYEYGELGVTAVFVVEDDRRFHLAYADTLLDGESVGTKPAEEFDAAAEDAFTALSESDCDAFIDVANQRHGPGTAEEDAICDYVDANPLPALVESFEELEPELIGANADYALYSLATPDEVLTMVLGRAEDSKELSETYEPLPDDAPEFGFVDLIATDPAEAQ